VLFIVFGLMLGAAWARLGANDLPCRSAIGRRAHWGNAVECPEAVVRLRSRKAQNQCSVLPALVLGLLVTACLLGQAKCCLC